MKKHEDAAMDRKIAREEIAKAKAEKPMPFKRGGGVNKVGGAGGGLGRLEKAGKK